jgi:large repetitive protein
VLVPGLTVTKTASTATSVAGAVVGFTLTVTNTGQTPYPAATVTDSLVGVLDDAAYNNDASASAGTVGFTSPALAWTGALAPAATVTITYSVTVANPDLGDDILTNTAVSAAVGSNCAAGGTDPRCTASVAVARLVIVTTADVATITPGGVVRVNSTYTNTGQVAYTGISIAFDASSFADDADGNGDQTASSGTLTIGGNGALWTGDIPVGGTVTLTGSATVHNPYPALGDHVLGGTSSSAAPGNNCPVGGTDPQCTFTVTILVPGLNITKTADTASAEPGDTVGYTVTVTNSGDTAYLGIGVADALAGVLDDATYNADAVATAGALAFTSPTLTWSGDLGVGAVVTITYTVTVRSPDPGDKTLVNTVTSAAVGSNCSAAGSVAACTVTVVVLTPGLTIAKTANATTAIEGGTLTYTVTISNSGQVAQTGISVADSLSGLLDDAVYNDDAAASAGTVTFTSPVLTWAGNVGIGATVTLTYTVTLDNPDLGDRSLVDTVTSAAVGANCPVGGTDPRCSVTVAEVPSTTLTFTKTADVTSTVAGSVVHYTVTVANAAATPYVGAVFTDSLAGVLDDAVYNNDAAVTGAATVTYTAPVLSFAGDVPATGSVVVTYSVTVHAAGGGGDGVLTNRVLSVSADSNCPADSTDPRCVARVTVSGLHILSTADVATVAPGGLVTFTATFTNTGQTPYFGIAVNLGGGDLIDDADPTGVQTVSSGAIVIGADGPQWIGDLPVGGVVTVAAVFQVKNPDPANQLMTNTLVSAVPGNNCPTGSTDPDCTVSVAVLLPALTITKTVDAPFTVPGATVGFTVTITNSGTAPYTGATVADTMAGALDDATFTNDATTTLGALSFAGSTLTWTGDLAPTAAATITYTMTVRAPDPGDKIIVDRVSSTDPGSTCPPASSNPDCAVLLAVLTPDMAIATTAGVASTAPGTTVGFTTTVTNTGQIPQFGVSVTNALTGVLDDAAYNNDAAASAGTVTFTSPNLVWTGTIAPGSTVTITFTVTVANPDAGNRILTTTLSSDAAGNNCPTGGTDPACTATVTVSVLSMVNTADVVTTVPGAQVRYTTTVTNTGQTPYTAISIDASFVGSLDDANYNGDAAASSGTLVLNPGTGTIRWTGDLPVGAVLTVTGSFTVRDPDPGNKTMTSVVRSAVPGNNCPTGGTDPACTATVTVLIPGLAILKTADTATTTPGATVGYTITLTNNGQTPYPAATVADDLSGLLSMAAYNNDASATTGTLTYTAPTLSWTGALATGATVAITYTITVNSPASGTRLLTNPVTSTTPGSNCPNGGTDPACTVTVTVLVPALTITKTADTATTVPGATVGYTITITNTGQTTYTGATATDTLTDVLDDAAYTNNATATTGTVTYTAPALTWTGDLAVGATATITYTVAVTNPATGDHTLTNPVTSTTTGNNCPDAGTDPACTTTVTVLIPALHIVNTADVATTTPGSVIRFTATFTNTGPTPYTGIQIAINAADVFDDATRNGNEVASSGTLTVVGAVVTWTGDIPIGGVVTVTGTVTVNNPDNGNRTLTSTITTTTPGTNCPAGAPGPDCAVAVLVLIPGLTITKTANSPNTTPGGTVGYTITATNTGQTTYTATTITDNLTGLLDDATFTNNATATTGTLTYTAPTLTWTGDLPIGATATITYTVTADNPQTGEFVLTNTVTSTAPANNCPPASTDPHCTATVVVLIPQLSITKTADTATITAGQSINYTITVTNTGQTPYTGATFDDPLTTVLDDATYTNNATATTGTIDYTAPTLTWTGNLAIGATATITYTLAVTFPDTGNTTLTNTVTSTTIGTNCPTSGTDPACTATVTVLIPALTITKTTDTNTIVAGGTVRYTITITNTGQSPYTSAVVTDSLTGALDDATYNNNATANTGAVSYTAPVLTWTGDLPPTATAVITYTINANQPDTGDGHLINTTTSTTTGNNCPTNSTDPRCTTTTDVAAQAITLTSLPTTFTLNGLPDTDANQNDAVTMTVTTNSPTGYTVSVKATAPQLVATRPGNTNTIPINNLRVRETGTQTYQPLSDQTPVTVHNQNTPSATGGDAISTDYQTHIPFIPSGTYTVTLEYIATAQ